MSDQHVDGTKIKKTRPIENPIGKNLSVTVSLPRTIEIRMVDASTLEDYEFMFFITSIFASATAGFLSAFAQDVSKLYLLVVTIILFIVTLLFLWYTVRKRNILNRKTKKIKLKVESEIIQEGD